MKATYQHIWLWFLVAILMVPTAYAQGETVLGAYFMNGNTDVFSSRIYLRNPSDNPGDVTVRVFTLPPTSGTTEELTTEPLAIGTLGAKSAFSINLAEDILTPIGVSVPYTDDGGNLTLEFTIGVAGVQGVAQVFSGDFAFGTYPLQVISETGTNTATGASALSSNTTGSDNTATGASALSSNTTGNGNIAIGFEAGVDATTGDDNIYIGNQGVAAESNTIRIGDGSIHTRAFIAGIQNPVSGLPTQVLVDTNGQLGTFFSSRRFKEDIRDMGESSSGLMQLRPVQFRYKTEYANGQRPLQFGLIAEEVAPVFPELVQYSATGEAQTVLYHQLPAMLLNELQKQHRQNQVQKEQIAELTERLARLEQVLTAQQSLAALAE